MKIQWIKNATFFILLGMSVTVSAQEYDKEQEKRPKHEIPSPESNARRLSKEVKKNLQLTDEQYTKVYGFYLDEQKAALPGKNAHSHMPSQGGMGRPPHGGGHGGPGMDGGMPPMDSNFRPDFGGKDSKDMEKLMQEQEKKREKAYKKLDKKMKKLLTNEQYTKWKTWEIDRKSKGSQRRMEN